MGEKSRGNFSVGWCGETACLNRNRKCDKCIRKDKLVSDVKRCRLCRKPIGNGDCVWMGKDGLTCRNCGQDNLDSLGTSVLVMVW